MDSSEDRSSFSTIEVEEREALLLEHDDSSDRDASSKENSYSAGCSLTLPELSVLICCNSAVETLREGEGDVTDALSIWSDTLIDNSDWDDDEHRCFLGGDDT